MLQCSAAGATGSSGLVADSQWAAPMCATLTAHLHLLRAEDVGGQRIADTLGLPDTFQHRSILKVEIKPWLATHTDLSVLQEQFKG